MSVFLIPVASAMVTEENEETVVPESILRHEPRDAPWSPAEGRARPAWNADNLASSAFLAEPPHDPWLQQQRPPSAWDGQVDWSMTENSSAASSSSPSEVEDHAHDVEGLMIFDENSRDETCSEEGHVVEIRPDNSTVLPSTSESTPSLHELSNPPLRSTFWWSSVITSRKRAAQSVVYPPSVSSPPPPSGARPPRPSSFCPTLTPLRMLLVLFSVAVYTTLLLPDPQWVIPNTIAQQQQQSGAEHPLLMLDATNAHPHVRGISSKETWVLNSAQVSPSFRGAAAEAPRTAHAAAFARRNHDPARHVTFLRPEEVDRYYHQPALARPTALPLYANLSVLTLVLVWIVYEHVPSTALKRRR